MGAASRLRVFSLQIHIGLSVCGLSDREADIMQLSLTLRHPEMLSIMSVGHLVKLSGF